MIGTELVELLIKDNDNVVTLADLKDGYDLTDYETCKFLCEDIDEVYHLVGGKGSPRMTNLKPLDFMFPMLQCDTNMIRAAIECKVKKFLYTSSIAVLNPQTDKYPAWAKMTGETLLEATKIQYPWFKSVVVRPSNCYGKFDNFSNINAMVITSLINNAFNNDVIEVWGDGSEIRDFVNAKDVAKGMIKAMDVMPDRAINLCSGKETTIKEVVEAIQCCFVAKGAHYNPTQSSGDKKRVMITNGDLIGWKAEINIEDGIKEVIEYYAKR